MMDWLPYLLALGAAVAIGRIVLSVRRLRNQVPQDDWDAKLIERLRLAGSDPFQPHEVDFFLAMPTENAAQLVSSRLQSEGYRVSVKPVPENVDQPFSLHVMKSLRLSVPDMREISRGLAEIAQSHGGRYDGWTAGKVARES